MTEKDKPSVLTCEGGPAVILTPTADGNLDVTARMVNGTLNRLGRVINPRSKNPCLELIGAVPFVAVMMIFEATARRAIAKGDL